MHSRFLSPTMSSSRKSETSAKRRLRSKPTAEVLDREVKSLVPESAQLEELLQFERRLDTLIQRKKLDIHNVLNTVQTTRRTLRLYLTTMISQHEQALKWTIRVEGHMLNASHSSHKLTTLVRRFVVECKNAGGGKLETFEWSKCSSSAEADGFEMSRDVTMPPQTAKVLLQLCQTPEQYKLPARLAAILGIHTGTEAAITASLWAYIDTRKLQSRDDPDHIVCDDNLRSVFDKERLRFASLPTLLAGVMQKADPIALQVEFPSPPQPSRFRVYDVEFDMDDQESASGMTAFLFSSNAQAELKHLTDKSVELQRALDSAREQRDMMMAFADSPQFILTWLASQQADRESAEDASDLGNDRRRASFYAKPWTETAVARYLQEDADRKRVLLEQQYKALLAARS